MERLGRFEHNRWVGDKRNQLVHDIDHCTGDEIIGALVAGETWICFGPDSLAEARNRGYKRCRECAGAREAARAEATADATTG